MSMRTRAGACGKMLRELPIVCLYIKKIVAQANSDCCSAAFGERSML